MAWHELPVVVPEMLEVKEESDTEDHLTTMKSEIFASKVVPESLYEAEPDSEDHLTTIKSETDPCSMDGKYFTFLLIRFPILVSILSICMTFPITIFTRSYFYNIHLYITCINGIKGIWNSSKLICTM
ncbi:uncharacterized protein O3C94_006052 [Discoglossus pictus]